MSDTTQQFDTVGYVELLKCALDGEMTYSFTSTDDEGELEVKEWGFEHIGDDEDLVEAIREDPIIQARLERLQDGGDE